MLKWDEPCPVNMTAGDFIRLLEQDITVDPITTDKLSTEKGRLDINFQLGRRSLAFELNQWRLQKRENNG